MMISASTSTRSRLCARRGAGVRRAARPCDKVSFYSSYLLLICLLLDAYATRTRPKGRKESQFQPTRGGRPG